MTIVVIVMVRWVVSCKRRAAGFAAQWPKPASPQELGGARRASEKATGDGRADASAGPPPGATPDSSVPSGSACQLQDFQTDWKGDGRCHATVPVNLQLPWQRIDLK